MITVDAVLNTYQELKDHNDEYHIVVLLFCMQDMIPISYLSCQNDRPMSDRPILRKLGY